MASKVKIADLMGKVVLVHQVFKRSYEGLGGPEYRTWKPVQAQSRPGWVVGERWLQDGHAFFDSAEVGVSWRRKLGHSVHCLLVTYWPTMKPVKVPLDGFKLAPETTKPYPPVDGSWTEENRKSLREEMKDWPRDERGRWLKK